MNQRFGLEREGFRVHKTTFIPPPDTSPLDPSSKRRLTICNLFLNHQMPLAAVAGLLEDTYGNVVQALIQEGVILERRSSPRQRH